MSELLQSIANDIKSIFENDIETTNAYTVPSRHDAGLTFPIGETKKGKLLETCVLFVDIRNSTLISRKLRKDKVRLGKIYEAFIYAMTRIADEYGYVRNIVGDRVMVVFEPKDCFTNSINCAADMHTVAMKLIKKHAGIDEFKVGIGIDYGELLILKTGIIKRHEEQSEYKGLVWVGDSANIASKLTDLSSKQYASTIFDITYEQLEYTKVFKGYQQNSFSIPLDILMGKTGYSPTPIYENKLVKKEETVRLDINDFASKVTINEKGWRYNGYKIIKVSKHHSTGTSSPILMSGTVYNNYKQAVPGSPYLKTISKKEYPNSIYVDRGIYGGSFYNSDIQNIK